MYRWQHYCSTLIILYSGKLLREKTLWISWFCGYMRKFSLRNLGRDVLWRRKSEQSAKVFSAKIVFSPICESFLPQKFSAIRYIILWEVDYMLNLVNSNLQYDPIQLRRVHVCNCMIVLALFPGLSQLFVTSWAVVCCPQGRSQAPAHPGTCPSHWLSMYD